jgi:hypothetical protein
MRQVTVSVSTQLILFSLSIFYPLIGVTIAGMCLKKDGWEIFPRALPGTAEKATIIGHLT